MAISLSRALAAFTSMIKIASVVPTTAAAAAVPRVDPLVFFASLSKATRLAIEPHNGLAPPPWQGGPYNHLGTIFAARTDGEDFTVMDWKVVHWDYFAVVFSVVTWHGCGQWQNLLIIWCVCVCCRPIVRGKTNIPACSECLLSVSQCSLKVVLGAPFRMM